MFKVAKSIQVSKEKAIVQVVEAKIGHFDRIGKGFRPCASAHKFL